MKRRRAPDSSQRLERKPGYFASRLSRTSFTVEASISTTSAPLVSLRNGVGMTTLSDMVHTPQDRFERPEFCFDHLRRREIQRIKRFQAVARYGEDREICPFDLPLLHQFLRNRYCNSACCLR